MIQRAIRILLLSLFAIAIASCKPPAASTLQGYVEGEFVYVASPSAGALQRLEVRRGAEVPQGAALFTLESEPESQTRNEAARALDQAKALLEDAKKGQRPTELDALKARIAQARAAATFAEKELERQENLSRSPGVTAKQDLERARSLRDQTRGRVVELEAELTTAGQSARTDQVAAAEAVVHAREAALLRAEWTLGQKAQKAPQGALVFDTYYREGEWVPAGRPVVSLLPAGNIKVRTYVSELKVGGLRLGQGARVSADGRGGVTRGVVTYISPKHEFTPPVIYSKENRAKLVFRVEISFDADTAAGLHPGQPVDVEFES